MYAIIETGGKQYKVSEGDVIKVEKLAAEAGTAYAFDKVLVVAGDNGVSVGAPYVEGAKVAATVIGDGKAKKVIIYKYKSKKASTRKKATDSPIQCLRSILSLFDQYDSGKCIS